MLGDNQEVGNKVSSQSTIITSGQRWAKVVNAVDGEASPWNPDFKEGTISWGYALNMLKGQTTNINQLAQPLVEQKRDPVPEKIDNVLLVLCKLFAKVKPNMKIMKDKCNKHYPRLTVDKHDMIILTKFSLGSFDTELFEVICMLSLKCANGSTIQWDNNTYNCIHAGIRFYTQYKFSHKVPWLSPSK